VRLEYATPGGPLTFEADSYKISPENGRISLQKPRVTDERGVLLASVDSVEAIGLVPKFGADQIADVRVRNLYARIERDADGKFALQRYLPTEEGEPGKVPFRVAIDTAAVDFIDASQGAVLRRRLETRQALVSGLGDDWHLRTQARIVGVGRLDLDVQQTADKAIHIGATTMGPLRADPILALLRRDIPRAFDWQGISAKGRGRARIDSAGTSTFAFDLDSQAERLSAESFGAQGVTFRGLVTDRAVAGAAGGRSAGTGVRFRGSARYGLDVVAAGFAEVAAASPGALPAEVRKLLPRDIGFQNADYAGWVAYAEDRLRTYGEARVASARYQGETIGRTVAYLDADDRGIHANLPDVGLRGQRGAGLVAADFRSQALRGVANLRQVDLAALGVDGLRGNATVRALARGTFAKPQVDFVAVGAGGFRPEGRPEIVARSFEAAGTYANGLVSLRRSFIDSPAGLVVASGEADADGMDIDFTARGLRFDQVDSRLDGVANARGNIAGTLRNPVATGFIEAYAIEFEGEAIPVAQSNFRVTAQGARLTGFEAVRGTTFATGSFGYAFRSGRIDGAFGARDFMLADLTDEEVVGTADITQGYVSGTLENPRASLALSGKNVVVRGIKVDDLVGTAELRDGMLRVPAASASILDGTASLTATYDLDRRRGEVAMEGKGIALRDLGSELTSDVVLEGESDVSAKIALADGAIQTGTLDLSIRDLVANGAQLGNGSANLALANDFVTGGLSVGTIERYIQISDLNLSTTGGPIAGRIDAVRVPIATLTQAAGPYLQGLTYDQRTAIQQTAGEIILGATLTGEPKEPDVAVDAFEIPELRFENKVVGKVEAKGSRIGGVWDIRQASVTGPVGIASVTGRVEEEADISLDGEISNLDVEALAVFLPQIGQRKGTITLPFTVSGQTRTPTVQAALQTSGLLLSPTEDPARAINVSLDQIELTPTNGEAGRISIGGVYRWIGYQGRITATAPFAYPFGVPNDQPVEANLTVAERPLTEIAELSQTLDPRKTEGTLSGGLGIQGTLENLQAVGGLVFRGPRIGFKGVDNSIRDFEGRLSILDRKITVAATGTSSLGGSANASVEADVPGLARLIDTFASGGIDELLASPVVGTVAIDNYRHRQTFNGGTFLEGRVAGQIAVSGSVRSPLVAGDLTIRNVDTNLAGLENGQGAAMELAIDPRFDIRMNLRDAHLRVATADVNVTGSGALQGSLSSPEARADLLLEKGSIRLPGGLVRLERDGEMRFTYDSRTGQPEAQLQVDLEGRTNIAVVNAAQTAERYDVYISLTGDLIRENGLNLAASSDPPGLSQDRILALLGQTELLTGLASGNRSDTEERLRNAFTSFALPAFLDPFTAQLADNLGLDYLSLDYNPFDRVSIFAVKSLNRDFSIQARRQLSQPLPGLPIRYDFRLVYRPPRLKGVLSRVNFSIGTDELRPFKLAVDYSVRF